MMQHWMPPTPKKPKRPPQLPKHHINVTCLTHRLLPPPGCGGGEKKKKSSFGAVSLMMSHNSWGTSVAKRVFYFHEGD